VITSSAFAGKHYAVLGLARSGLASVEALLASGARVTAWDDRAEARAAVSGGVIVEDFVGSDLKRFDSIVVTPGLPLNRHPIAAAAQAAGVEIVGDIELFARARPELPRHKVVGITGTNGKSTTTALVHHILQTAGVPSLMGGNIGLPILAQEPLPEGGVYVLELSSYQLDLTQSLDCDVAVLLNITPDHLDRYSGFAAYVASKVRLLEMQSKGHSIVFGHSVHQNFRQIYDRFFLLDRGSDVQCMPSYCVQDPADLWNPFNSDDWLSTQQDWPALQGPHNAENAAAAFCAAYSLGVENRALARAFETFPGLPHRMERIAEKDGVLFVNDSKATNPTATAPALAAFPAIRWVLGGQAKSDNLDECAPHFPHVRKAYTIGEASGLFASLLTPHMAVAECGTLDVAVKAAASEAKSGDTVLLSPACASFDQFKDFEARGDAFRSLVEAL